MITLYNDREKPRKTQWKRHAKAMLFRCGNYLFGVFLALSFMLKLCSDMSETMFLKLKTIFREKWEYMYMIKTKKDEDNQRNVRKWKYRYIMTTEDK